MKQERSRLEDMAALEAFRASVTRRDVLKYGVAAAMSFSVVDALLAACSPSHGTGTTTTSKTPTGNQVVFTLRQGLTYNDGTPITAQIIEQGYRRIFEAQGISYFLLSMAAVPDPSHVKALDDRRVAITMDAPNLLLMKNNTMHNTSALDIKDVKAHATSTDQWATDYFKKNLAPGNGPF